MGFARAHTPARETATTQPPSHPIEHPTPNLIPDNDPEPPIRCKTHASNPHHDDPCGPCANFRKAHERWETRMARRHTTRQQTQAQQRRDAIAACHQCDEAGWQLDPDGKPAEPARRCPHGAP